MPLIARVRLVLELPLEDEVPELEFEQSGPEDRPVFEATNERKVLKARGAAAKSAERLAKERFSGDEVVDVQVEGVEER